ncbi:MAG: hypothetical protein KF696_02140 [Planctomycetes bacterium]|nr:hypothetical protein [Planctomycetota bacterium]MCW8134801.1 hypothetical protein [Planctomycetota bacterium]
MALTRHNFLVLSALSVLLAGVVGAQSWTSSFTHYTCPVTGDTWPSAYISDLNPFLPAGAKAANLEDYESIARHEDLCDLLEHITLRTPVTSEFARYVAAHKNLRSISITVPVDLDPGLLSLFAKSTTLKSIQLNGDVQPDCVSNLVACVGLTGVGLSGTIRPETVKAAAGLPNLWYLYVNVEEWTDDLAKSLGDCTSVRYLHVQGGVRVRSDQGLLETRGKVEAASWVALRNLKNLSSLRTRNVPGLNGEAVRRIVEGKAMRMIDGGGTFAPDDLKAVLATPTLEVFRAGMLPPEATENVNLSDLLRPAKSLHTLHSVPARMLDAGMRTLTQLRDLDVFGNNTDSGQLKASLANLPPRLKRLTLSGIMSADDVRAFETWPGRGACESIGLVLLVEARSQMGPALNVLNSFSSLRALSLHIETADGVDLTADVFRPLQSIKRLEYLQVGWLGRSVRTVLNTEAVSTIFKNSALRSVELIGFSLKSVEFSKTGTGNLVSLSIHGCTDVSKSQLLGLAESTVQDLDISGFALRVDLSLLKALVEKAHRRLVVVPFSAFEDEAASVRYLRSREYRCVVEDG